MYCNKCGAQMDDKGLFCTSCGNKVRRTQDSNYVYEFKSPIVCKLTNRIFLWLLPAIFSFIAMALNYIQINNYDSIDKLNGYSLILGNKLDADTTSVMLVVLIVNNVMVIGTGLLGKFMNSVLAGFLMIVEALTYCITAWFTYFNLTYEIAGTVQDKIRYDTGIGCYLNITVAVATLILFFICSKTECCIEVDNKARS